jgi:hypothetical protein
MSISKAAREKWDERSTRRDSPGGARRRCVLVGAWDELGDGGGKPV